MFGEHEIIQKVLEKLVIIDPEANFSETLLWKIKGQVEIKLGQINQAAETFKTAITSIESPDRRYAYHLQLAALEEKQGKLLEARHLLEHARSLENSKFSYLKLWAASIRFELRAN